MWVLTRRTAEWRGISAEKFATVVKDDIDMYRKIAIGTGIKPE
jgi:hypothetical protein